MLYTVLSGVQDFFQIVSPSPDQLFTYSFLYISDCFSLWYFLSFIHLLRFSYFRMLNLKCNEKDTSEVTMKEIMFDVEQLLSDLDGAKVHSSLFITS